MQITPSPQGSVTCVNTWAKHTSREHTQYVHALKRTPWITFQNSGSLGACLSKTVTDACSAQCTHSSKDRKREVKGTYHSSLSSPVCLHTWGSNVCMHAWGTSSSVGYTDSFEHTQGGGDRDLVTQQQKQQIINVGEVNAWWFRFTTAGRRTGGRVIIRMVSGGSPSLWKALSLVPLGACHKKNLNTMRHRKFGQSQERNVILAAQHLPQCSPPTNHEASGERRQSAAAVCLFGQGSVLHQCWSYERLISSNSSKKITNNVLIYASLFGYSSPYVTVNWISLGFEILVGQNVIWRCYLRFLETNCNFFFF